MSPSLSRYAVCGSALLLAALAAASCSSSSGGGTGGGPDASGADSTGGGACTPGDQKSCACPGSSVTGAQVCNADGTAYGVCMGCQGSGSSSGASGSSSGSSGGSSGSSSGTSGGSSGSSSGGISDSGTDSTGDGASCDGGSLMPVCADCVNASAANATSPCTPQANACGANPDCQNLNQCLGNCSGSGDPACATMCQNMYPNGVADMNALNACICEPCVCKQACASSCP